MSAATLEPGAALGGGWTLGPLVGRGGHATVYAVTHDDGERAAAKILHPRFADDPAMRERFRRESYVSLAVVHPGVVRVLDEGATPDGAPFMVMELLEGRTVWQLRPAATRRLPVGVVVDVLLATLDVLEAVHQKGIVHRDIKPDNLFVLAGGGVKLLDFGIAWVEGMSAAARQHLTGASPIGTPGFLAPEQAAGTDRAIDPRTDVFGVGATAFVLLTGMNLHEGATAAELWAAAKREQVDPIRSVDPSIPAVLADVVDRALRFDPADRWPGAAAMRRALEAARVELDAAAGALDEATTPGLHAPTFGESPTVVANTRGGLSSALRTALDNGNVPRVIGLAAAAPALDGPGQCVAAEAYLWAGDARAALRLAEAATRVSTPGTQAWADASAVLTWAMLRTEDPRVLEIMDPLVRTLIADATLSPHPEALPAMLVLAHRRAAAELSAAIREIVGRESALPRGARPSARGSLLRAESWIAHFEGRLGESVHLARSAVETLGAAGAELSACRARQQLGGQLAELGAYAEAAAHYRAALRTARRRGLGWLTRFTEYALAAALRRTGHLTTALALERRAIEWATADGDASAVLQCRLDLGWMLFDAGDVGAAAAELEEVLARTVTVQIRGQALGLLAAVALSRGQVPLAKLRAEEALDVSGGTFALARVVLARALVREGDEARAAEVVARGCELVRARLARVGDPELSRSFGEISEHRALLDLESELRGRRAGP